VSGGAYSAYSIYIWRERALYYYIVRPGGLRVVYFVFNVSTSIFFRFCCDIFMIRRCKNVCTARRPFVEATTHEEATHVCDVVVVAHPRTASSVVCVHPLYTFENQTFFCWPALWFVLSTYGRKTTLLEVGRRVGQ
jgi:hypothetical protein